MNVLHLISGRGPTGAAAAALSDAKALRAAGQTVYVVPRYSTVLAQHCAQAQLTVPCVLWPERRERLLELRRSAQRLRDLVRELAIDVLHVHRSDDQFLARMALGRSCTTRLVRTWHRDPRHLARRLFERLTGRVDGCVCVAREHAEVLCRAGIVHAEFIPPGVDTELFRPAETPPAPPWLGQVGRWKLDRNGDRGQGAALAVLNALPRNLPWKGLLIGRGEREAELRREAYEVLGLSAAAVEFRDVTALTPPEFARLLGSLSLGMVFRAGSDGTSRAAVEMLACGVPILVADSPGLRELADDPACAVRLLPDDPAGWAGAIAKLLCEPEKLRAMAAAARRRAESTHALNVRGAALAEFYRNCV
jgi:glycosyltransferase involved in cell wall biosynthesis